MQQSPPITTPIKLVLLVNVDRHLHKYLSFRTMQLKEVPLDGRRRKKLPLCSLPIRLTLEVLLILLLFVPAIIFLMKWPAAKSFIHGKVLSVSIICYLIGKKPRSLMYHSTRKHVWHQHRTALKIGRIHQ